METRKAPHFLNDIDSYFFTNVEHFAWWRENLNYNFTKTKLFQFQYKNLKKFLRRDDWGISHSAHIHEPFGYSIFQAVDYGKIPILSEKKLYLDQPEFVILFSWHISSELKSNLKKRGFKGKFIIPLPNPRIEN